MQICLEIDQIKYTLLESPQDHISLSGINPFKVFVRTVPFPSYQSHEENPFARNTMTH